MHWKFILKGLKKPGNRRDWPSELQCMILSAWVVEGQMKYSMCSDAYIELIEVFYF